MEIEVNDYVKLDNGNIGNVIAVEKGSIMLDIVSNRWVGMCCIKKHSQNLIDLIEIGDILRVFDNLSETEEKVNIFDDEMLKAVKKDIKDNNYKILSILTHEQFSSLEYII